MPNKGPSKKELTAKIEFLQDTVDRLLEDKELLIRELKALRRRVKMAAVFLDADTVFEIGEPPE